MKKKFKKSIKFHKRAIQSIPLATQTFSKSSLIYPYGASPLFIDRGKGCNVRDIDNNQYIDYILGLLPIILSYQDKDVDKAIRKQLSKGIIFSLPTTIEFMLAEELIKLIPSAEMVRFGKNGSDVTSAAIRLSRAYTRRDKIAICGYHSWHDWYIGTTTRNLGVPKSISKLSYNFKFNDLDSLFYTLKKNNPHKFAAIIIEPENFEIPNLEFLKGVRSFANKYGIVLIFDEIVSGFRSNLGGAQKKFGVIPDLSTFGKGIANGMPLSAIVGKKKIMKLMNDIFFSGTFGGEALSISAAIATLKKLKKYNAPKVFSMLGNKYTKELNRLIKVHGLNEIIKVKGVEWKPLLKIHSTDQLSEIDIISLFRQELIESGIILGSGFNFCLAHENDFVIKRTLSCLDKSLYRLSSYLKLEDPLSKLRGEKIKPVFQVR